MMYPFMTLDDQTEIVHSEMKEDGSVKVYMERPDEKDCFHYATCYLPMYKWEDVFGFSEDDMNRLKDVIESTAHLILRLLNSISPKKIVVSTKPMVSQNV